MRIGLDLRLPYYQMGGISQYALQLVRAFAERAVSADDHYLVVHHAKEGRDFTPTHPQFQRQRAFTPCHHRWERWALSAEIARWRCDVWHSPDFIPPQRGAKRMIITVHDLNFLHYPHYLTTEARRYYNDQIAWAVARADGISADSEHTRQDLIKLLGVSAEKVRTIPLAANPLYEKAVAPASLEESLHQWQLGRGFLLFVGTLEPRKNLTTLLHAYHRLRQTTPLKVPLVLVGRKGWFWEEIFATIEQLQLSADVRHLSNISDEQLAHLYHSAGALVMPSHYEGFGLPPLEAMWCGCPVLVSNRASLPEVVGPAGLLLEADDVVAWCDGMERVLQDEKVRVQMVEAGFVQARRFSWALSAEKTAQLYRA